MPRIVESQQLFKLLQLISVSLSHKDRWTVQWLRPQVRLHCSEPAANTHRLRKFTVILRPANSGGTSAYEHYLAIIVAYELRVASALCILAP